LVTILACLAPEGLKSSIEQQHRDKISQQLLQLDAQQLEQLKQEFEAKTRQREDALGEEFRNKGWKGQFIEASYKIFLRTKMSEQILGQEFDDAVTAAQENHEKVQSLKQQLADTENQLAQDQERIQQMRAEKEATIDFSPVGFGSEVA